MKNALGVPHDCWFTFVAGGAMDGKFLDGSAVRRLEKMPNKLQLLTSVAVMIKKARSPSHLPLKGLLVGVSWVGCM